MPREETIPLALHRLGDDPRATLIKLFLLGVEVEIAEVERALPLDAAATCGLIEIRDGNVLSQVQMIPAGDLVFACDRPGGGGREHVVGPAPASILLSNLTVRGKVGAVLDLGTGCGIQAVAAARQVVATHLNARALEFTEFNRQLNGGGAIEGRQGSLGRGSLDE